MTINILDTILDEDESVPKTSFVVAKKTDKESINQEVKKIQIEIPATNAVVEDKLSTTGRTPLSELIKPTGENRIERIYKKNKQTRTEKIRAQAKEKISKKKQLENNPDVKISAPQEPLWLSVSEAAKIGGVEQKTIRRAIQSNMIKFKIIKDRYFIEFSSLVKYLYSNTKLRNKFLSFGVGQYVEKWI